MPRKSARTAAGRAEASAAGAPVRGGRARGPGRVGGGLWVGRGGGGGGGRGMGGGGGVGPQGQRGGGGGVQRQWYVTARELTPATARPCGRTRALVPNRQR